MPVGGRKDGSDGVLLVVNPQDHQSPERGKAQRVADPGTFIDVLVLDHLCVDKVLDILAGSGKRNTKYLNDLLGTELLLIANKRQNNKVSNLDPVFQNQLRQCVILLRVFFESCFAN
jgi:hypothetical protein